MQLNLHMADLNKIGLSDDQNFITFLLQSHCSENSHFRKVCRRPQNSLHRYLRVFSQEGNSISSFSSKFRNVCHWTLPFFDISPFQTWHSRHMVVACSLSALILCKIYLPLTIKCILYGTLTVCLKYHIIKLCVHPQKLLKWKAILQGWNIPQN